MISPKLHLFVLMFFFSCIVGCENGKNPVDPGPVPGPPGPFDLSGGCFGVDSSNQRAVLGWTTSVNAISYRIERRAWSTGQWENAGSKESLSFSQIVRDDVDFYWRVFAVNTDGEKISSPSELKVCVAKPPPPPRLVIDSPLVPEMGLKVTFRWRMENPEPGEIYQYDVRFDKGIDACNGYIEKSYPAGINTCLAVDVRGTYLVNESVAWAVRAVNSRGVTFCAYGSRLFFRLGGPEDPSCSK